MCYFSSLNCKVMLAVRSGSRKLFLVIWFYSQHFVRFLVCLVSVTYLAYLLLLYFIMLMALTQNRCLLRGFLHYDTLLVFQISVQQ
jgi:hypothetical protein